MCFCYSLTKSVLGRGTTVENLSDIKFTPSTDFILPAA